MFNLKSQGRSANGAGLPTRRLAAIVAFLQRKLENHGIELRSGCKGGRLLLLLEGNPAPARDRMTALVRQLTGYLQDEPLTGIEVCGRVRGERTLAWHARIPLQVGDGDLEAWLAAVTVPATARTSALPERRSASGQRFLRFRLDERDAALLPVDYIREVLGVTAAKILPVPHVPDSVLGIYNWRGQMLWLVDLARLLGYEGLASGAFEGNPDIMVLDVQRQLLGVVVRQVDTIEEHDWQKLQPPVGLFPDAMLAYVEGYLTQADMTILSAPALVRSPLWKHSNP